MSIRYRDRNGAETVVSGMTPGGNLETGAVATREGVYTISSAVAAGATGEAAITFSDPMPDADYEIVFNTTSTRLNVNVRNTKTANGFTLYWQNVSDAATGSVDVHWKAFKLYEVADAEQLYSTVQDIETMVPSNASSTNKFATINDLTGETRSLDRRLDDVEDVIPSSASISNKLVTQSDLSGVEIDKVEDINDVELTDIQNGQTLIWDGTNSKWVNGQGGKVYSAGDGITISNTDEISAKVDDTSITTDTNDALKVADTYKTIFVGTRAQWDALSTADKIKYNEAHITDDVIGGEVADVVQNGLMSPVTSNAVYDAVTDVDKVNTNVKPLHQIVAADPSIVDADSLAQYIFDNYCAGNYRQYIIIDSWAVNNPSDTQGRHTACAKAISDKLAELTGYSFTYAHLYFEHKPNMQRLLLTVIPLGSPSAIMTNIWGNAGDLWTAGTLMNQVNDWKVMCNEGHDLVSFNLTTNINYTQWTQRCTYHRTTRRVDIFAHMAFSSAQTTAYPFTIPEAYRPKTTVLCLGTYLRSEVLNHTLPCQVQIETNGNVRQYNNPNASTTMLEVQVSYYI